MEATSNPLSFPDRFELWISSGRVVDGLWVGGIDTDAVARAEAALEVIRDRDQRRYRRIRQDLSRVWVRLLPGHQASFNSAARACQLDERFVLDASVSTDEIAVAIVHEATHARIDGCGITYAPEQRLKIEIACRRQELAFARRLASSTRIQEKLSAWLASPPSSDVWANEAMREDWDKGMLANAIYLGIPKWLLPVLLWPRKPIGAVRRLVRTARGLTIAWSRQTRKGQP